MRQNQNLVRLGRKMRTRGEAALAGGSVVAHAAANGAAPGAGAPKPPAPAGGGEKKFNPLAALSGLETGKVLTGKQLAQGARALTALELRPQLHGYKQLANQLTQERNETNAGLGKLGTELQGNVGSVYNNIGASSAQSTGAQTAIASMLNQQAGQIAQQGSDNLTKMQTGALGDYTQALAMRGAPGGGSAQQQLTEAAAQQQAAQSANSQASQQFAAAQGASGAQLQAALGSAAQLQGGAAVGGIGRDVLGRVGESNQKYGESIQTALGKLADVKATKGATMTKNLLGLREGEQKFLLGKQAVQGEKAKLGLEGQELQVEKEQNTVENQINQEKASASLTSAAASARNAAVAAYKAHHPAASSGELAERKKEIRQDTNEVKALIPGMVSAYGAPKTPKQLNQFILALNGKASADPTLVQKVVKAWWQERLKGLSKDPNGAALGR